MLQKIEAINLKIIPYSESSLIVIVFSKEQGRLSFIAKGARKSKKSDKGLLQSFLHNRYTISKRGKMGILSETSNIHSFSEILKDLDKINSAYECLEIIYHICQENHSQPVLFDILLKTLIKINEANQTQDIVEAFKKSLIEHEGVLPSNNLTANIDKVLENYLERKLASWGKL